MSNAEDHPEEEVPAASPRWQFRLGSLLLFLVGSALAWGLADLLDIGHKTAIFIIIFLALTALLAFLTTGAPRTMGTVLETYSEEEAKVCFALLQHHGITAEFRSGEFVAYSGVSTRPTRILVPKQDMPRARELLAKEMPPREDNQPE